MSQNPFLAPQEVISAKAQADTQTLRGAAKRGFQIGAILGGTIAILGVFANLFFLGLLYFRLQRLPPDFDMWHFIEMPFGVAIIIGFFGLLGSAFLVIFTRVALLFRRRQIPPRS